MTRNFVTSLARGVVFGHPRGMPRAPRDTAGGIVHVTCHSVWTSNLFRDEVDRLDILRELAQVIRAAAWTCISYCLMTNHLHVILEGASFVDDSRVLRYFGGTREEAIARLRKYVEESAMTRCQTGCTRSVHALRAASTHGTAS
jgi:REP element-mobilizing transposase RayT